MTNTNKPHHQHEFERETDTAKKLNTLYNFLQRVTDHLDSLRNQRSNANYTTIEIQTEYNPETKRDEPYNTVDSRGELTRSDDGKLYLQIEISTDGCESIPGLTHEIERANTEYIDHINGFIYDYHHINFDIVKLAMKD